MSSNTLFAAAGIALLLGWLAACDTNDTGDASDDGQGGAAPTTFLESYPLDARFPEGGAFDPVESKFYVGSLEGGAIYSIDAFTGVNTKLFEETADGSWWSLGMAVDAERRELWVCAMEDLRGTDASPAYDGYLWRFDLETKTRSEVLPLSDAAPEATCTDVAIATDGTVYVTDRDFGDVYRVAPGGPPTIFASDAQLQGEIIGQNAAVILPDQSALLIAVYLNSRIVRVDLQNSAVSTVAIANLGDDAFLAGADGLTLHDGAPWVVFSSKLSRLTPSGADWSSATAEDVDVPEGMTDAISTPNGLYLLNGQAVRYAFEQVTDPFALIQLNIE